MKRYMIMMMLVSAVMLISGCSGKEAAKEDTVSTAEYHRLSPMEAMEMMKTGDVTIVDVRNQDEYDERHLDGAICIPDHTIKDEMPEQLPDPDATLLIYCRSGRRSRAAAYRLLELGYRNVYDFGGLLQRDYEMEKMGL